MPKLQLDLLSPITIKKPKNESQDGAESSDYQRNQSYSNVFNKNLQAKPVFQLNSANKAFQKLQNGRTMELDDTLDNLSVKEDEEETKRAEQDDLLVPEQQDGTFDNETSNLDLKQSGSAPAAKLKRYQTFTAKTGKKFRFSNTSLFCLGRRNPLRKRVISTVVHPFFENFVLLCIIANSLSLSFYDYSNGKERNNEMIELLGYFFSVIFTIEAILKIISMGFLVNKHSYLRDPWNVMDFIIVLAGLVELATIGQGTSLGIFKALRTLRVLRPLKSIKQVPRMQKLVSALIGSIPDLGNVMIFFSFIFILFGIMGLQQFSGTLYGRCRVTERPKNATFWERTNDQRICSNEGIQVYSCKEGFCGNWLEEGQDPYELEGFRYDPKIQFGVSNFDNFFQAVIGVFQVITFDNWTAMMYNYMDGADSVIAIPFFIGLILFGSFFLINLILAVIMQSFNTIYLKELEEQKKTAEKAEKEVAEKYDPGQEERVKKAEENEKLAQQQMAEGGTFSLLGQVLRAAREKKSKEAEALKAQYEELDKEVDSDTKIQKQKELQKDNNILLQKLERGMKEKLTVQKKSNYGLKDEQDVIDQIQNKFDKGLKRFQTQRYSKDVSGEVGQLGKEKVMHGKNLSNNFNQQDSLRQVNQKEEIKDKKFLMKFALDLQQEVKEAQLKKHIFRSIGQKLLSIQSDARKLREAYEKNAKEIKREELKKRAKTSKIFTICLRVITSSKFEIFIPFCILLNSFILALDRYPQKKGVIKIQEAFNFFFYSVFFLEMVLKFLGLGFQYYFKDNFNSFDCFIVIVSSIDILMSNIIQANIQGANAITALRTFRLLRIFKLARSWKEFQNLLKTIGNTLIDIRDFSVLLLLFIFTACLLGREGFSYQVAFNSENKSVSWQTPGRIFPDSTFNTFLDSFLSVFIVLANDGWANIYMDHYRAVNSIGVTFYFGTLIMLGQFVMLNLFLAIMLNNFDADSVQQQILKQNEEKDEGEASKASKFDKFMTLLTRRFKCLKCLVQEKKEEANEGEEQVAETKKEGFSEKVQEARQKLYPILKSNKFEFTILFFILVSSITLAFENPLNNPKGQKLRILFWLDLVLTIIFTIEMVVKMFSFGILFDGEKSYMRSNENILDFLVVSFSLLSFFMPVGLNSLKVLRLLRVLRPIRLIAKNEGLKISIQSLIMAFPQIINVILINILFFGTFSIIGISLFKGMYFMCSGHIGNEKVETKWQCLDYGGTWERKAHNFDNFFDAFFSIFSISNTVGWAYTMYRSKEFTQEPGIKKLPGDNSFNTLFFVFFIIIGSFFITNLFVGVVISTYNREKEKLGKNYLLTDNQKKWLEAKILLISAKPKKRYKEPENPIRQKCFRIAQDDRFDYFITICIILNTLVLCLKWNLQPQGVTRATEILNVAFGLIFLIEIIIKLLGYGKRFTIDPWNIFDLCIVIGTVAGFILSRVSSFKRIGFTATIIRSFRIGRLFKLFKRNKSLKVIFQTFLISLPAIANVGSLLMLLIYIYAVMGVFLFSESKLVGLLDQKANFQTTSLAALTLFRAATGENWHEIAYSLTRERSLTYQCDETPTYEEYKEAGFNTIGCGDFWSTWIFFFSYIIIVSLIFLNLFIAIILQSFTDTQSKSKKGFNQEIKDQYVNSWVWFCPDGDKFMHQDLLPEFLLKLGKPLGWSPDFRDNHELQEYFIGNLNAKLFNEDKDVEFHDLLEQLTLLMIVNQEMDKYLHKGQDKKSEIAEIEEEKSEDESSCQFSDESFKTVKTNPEKKKKTFKKVVEGVNFLNAIRKKGSVNKRVSMTFREKQTKIKDQILNEVLDGENVSDAQIVKDLKKKKTNFSRMDQLSVSQNPSLASPSRINSPSNKNRRLRIMKQQGLSESQQFSDKGSLDIKLPGKRDLSSAQSDQPNPMDQIPEEEEMGFDHLLNDSKEQSDYKSQRSLIQVEDLSHRKNEQERSYFKEIKVENLQEDSQVSQIVKQEQEIRKQNSKELKITDEKEEKEDLKQEEEKEELKQVEEEVKFQDERLFDESNAEMSEQNSFRVAKKMSLRRQSVEIQNQSNIEEIKLDEDSLQENRAQKSSRRKMKKNLRGNKLSNQQRSADGVSKLSSINASNEITMKIKDVIKAFKQKKPLKVKGQTKSMVANRNKGKNKPAILSQGSSFMADSLNDSNQFMLKQEHMNSQAFQKTKMSFKQKQKEQEEEKMDNIIKEAEELLRQKTSKLSSQKKD